MGAEVVSFPARRPAPVNLRDAVLPCGADQLASLFNSLPKGRSMSDFAEQASELQDQHLAASLSRIDPTMPVGTEGDCENCGDHFKRLVGGLCGFCRDNRRPHFGRQPTPSHSIAKAAVPAIPATPTPGSGVIPEEKDHDMANPKPSDDFRNVSVLARGPILQAIMARADQRDLSLNKAAISLIEDALAGRTGQSLVDLSTLPVTDLLEEIGHRLTQATSKSELVAATARAEAAEARLAKVQAAIGGTAA